MYSSHLSDFQIKSLETAYHEYLKKSKGLNFADEMADIEKKFEKRRPSDKRKRSSKHDDEEDFRPPRKREDGEVDLHFRAHIYLPRKMNTDDIKKWLDHIRCNHGMIQFEMSKSYTHANLFIERREDYDIIMKSDRVDNIKVFKYKA